MELTNETAYKPNPKLKGTQFMTYAFGNSETHGDEQIMKKPILVHRRIERYTTGLPRFYTLEQVKEALSPIIYDYLIGEAEDGIKEAIKVYTEAKEKKLFGDTYEESDEFVGYTRDENNEIEEVGEIMYYAPRSHFSCLNDLANLNAILASKNQIDLLNLIFKSISVMFCQGADTDFWEYEICIDDSVSAETGGLLYFTDDGKLEVNIKIVAKDLEIAERDKQNAFPKPCSNDVYVEPVDYVYVEKEMWENLQKGRI